MQRSDLFIQSYAHPRRIKAPVKGTPGACGEIVLWSGALLLSVPVSVILSVTIVLVWELAPYLFVPIHAIIGAGLFFSIFAGTARRLRRH